MSAWKARTTVLERGERVATQPAASRVPVSIVTLVTAERVRLSIVELWPRRHKERKAAVRQHAQLPSRSVATADSA